MENEKNAVNRESKLIGIHSQKQGRFLIQEIEEENKKIFFSPKNYSFDSKRIIFAYHTYDFNSNFQNESINNNSKNNNSSSTNDIHNINVNEINNILKSSTKELNSIEILNTLNSLNSSNKECFEFPEPQSSSIIINNKDDYLELKEKSEENYFSGKNNNDNNNKFDYYNNISTTQIKSYVLNVEDKNYNFLDFDLIWKQFIRINEINLCNNQDKRIFRYHHKPTTEKTLIIKSKKSSLFSCCSGGDQRSSHQSKNPQSQKKIEKKISNTSSLKKFLRYNSDIKSSLTTNKQCSNANHLITSQNSERIEKRNSSGEQMSIFKHNNMKNSCSSFSRKKKNYNDNYKGNNYKKDKRISSLKTAFSNNNNNFFALPPPHSNFKSDDLEINYGLEENEDTESNNNNADFKSKSFGKKKLPLKRSLTNKTKSEGFKVKLHNHLHISNNRKNKEAKHEPVNTDILRGCEIDQDAKKKENNKNEEYKTNKKSILYYYHHQYENGNGNDLLTGAGGEVGKIDYKEDFENSNNFLLRFHSQGSNGVDTKKGIYIDDEFVLEKADFNFNKNLNKYKNKANFNKNNWNEELEYDLLIPKVNFDSDKNIVSDFNPLIKIENNSNLSSSNNNNENHIHEKIRMEKVFEKEPNETNEKYVNKLYYVNESNNYNNNNDLEDLLKSPLETLFEKGGRHNNINNFNKINNIGGFNRKYKSWNLNIDNDNNRLIENSIQNPFIRKSIHMRNINNTSKEKKINKENLEYSNPTKDKLDIFALEEEEDHFYYSFSSINTTPKSKAAIAAVSQKKETQLFEKLNAEFKQNYKAEAAAGKEIFINNENYKTFKTKLSYLAAERKTQTKNIPAATSPKRILNVIPKFELSYKHLSNNSNNKNNNPDIINNNKKLKNPHNNAAKLNIIKSIQKSFVEDEKQKLGILISRINSADRKFNCVKRKKSEIENTQFEILPCVISKENEENENENENEEESDSYMNLEVMRVISIELRGAEQRKNSDFDFKVHFCLECQCKD